jgi:hypothetical protein
MAGPARQPVAPQVVPSRPSPARTTQPKSKGTKTTGGPAKKLPNGPTTPAAPVSGNLIPGEIDLSSGVLQLSEQITAETKSGQQIDVPVRLPGLAEGMIKLRRSRDEWNSVGSGDAILLRHPALAAIQVSTVLVVRVRAGQIGGFVSVGQPGPAQGDKHALFRAIARGPELVGWTGLSKISLPTVKNEFVNGAIVAAVENLSFTVGGFLSGKGSAALDNAALSFEGSAKVDIPGGSSGELSIKKDPQGELSGSLNILVSVGGVTGTVVAALQHGFVHIQGTVAYSGDRMSGKVTLIATDEATARDITLKKPTEGELPIEAPSTEASAKPGKRAFAGWGVVTFSITDWLAGSAQVIINSKGQATIIGEIAPPKEFILFHPKTKKVRLFKFEARAGYGIPVVGQVFVFASVQLDAKAILGPAKLYNIKLEGVYSSDPRVTKQLSLQASLNISAFAGLIMRAEGGVGITILGHDIKAGVGLDATAGVRGYVEATPKIGMRQAPGQKAEYFLEGHMEIAAQPFLGFGGDLFVSVDTPWWSPLSDKRWTWPLFNLEYPLPGEFGIGADVKYLLGSNQWPDVTFGEVEFDSSKFMTDLLNDDVDKGKGGEQKKPGKWKEGIGGGAPGGARTKGGGKGGAGSQGGEDIGPIGEILSFSDGTDTHTLSIEEKGAETTTVMASNPTKIAVAINKWETQVDMLLASDVGSARSLIAKARAQATKLDKEADELGHKKLAAKNAKAYYEKHGKKGPRKKAGQAKKDLKKALREVRQLERALKETVQELSKIMAARKFESIDKEAAMQGGHESVRIIAEKTTASLRVAKKKNDEKYQELRKGPLGHGISRAGFNLVSGAATSTLKVGQDIAKARIKSGQINRRVYATLPPLAKSAVDLASGVGKKMRIPNLERARHKKKIEKHKLRPLKFVGKPKSPGKNLYHKQFVTEMRRQLSDQQRGLNSMTVDEWTVNLAKFSMNADVFTKLDASARATILAELKERGKKAKERTDTRIAQLNKGIAELQQKQQKSNKEIEELQKKIDWLEKAKARKAATRQAMAELRRTEAGEIAAPRREVLKPTYEIEEGEDPEIMQLKIIGRQGHERKVRDAVFAQLEKLRLSQANWSLLAGDASKLAILHRPDQVAGGYDRFEPLPPMPTNPTDDAGWKIYLNALKKMVGPQVVNKQIGEQWKDQIYKVALPDVRKAVPANEAYPIHLLNFLLQLLS